MEPTTNLRRRLFVAGLGMLTIYTVGTLGYYFLGHGKWRLADCAYMTVISLTTVGYGEILADLDKMAYARLFTAFLLVGGAGIAVYFLSVLTTYLVEGEFLERRRSKKMRKIVDNLSGHIIVCGGGGTGRHVVEELMATRWSFVLVDTDAEKLERFQEEHDNQLPVIQGDATDDHVLLDAGIKRAHGIVASLPDDKGNLYVVVTARGLNPKLRIVSKAVEADATRKITAAGADAVISVNAIGGLRMASEMIRPQVVTFLDKMMRDKDKKLRFEEVTIPERSPLVDKKLAQTDIRRERNLLIVAARGAEGTYVYSPGPDFVLQAGMTLILLGETDSVQRLRGSSMFQWEDEDPSR